MNEPTTSSKQWFARGAVGGVMIFAALNALSWFWLSDAWTDLCGATQNAGADAIGFPFEIWREGNYYGSGWMINYPWLGVNLILAIAIAFLFGWIGSRFASRLQQLVEGAESTELRKLNFTFSVRGLFVTTTIAAFFLGITRMLGVSPWLLGAIYFGGPLVLILIAMAPVGLHWEQRMIIVVAFAILMLVGCVMVGTKMGMEFDRVLIGVFICWVPQSVFAAFAVLMWSMSPFVAGEAKA
ncbi:hypothetical protein [Mariniblastus fucicola]|uniref:Uncharacterized protein n=1 Tax=Mariniblastus fucicola TaxID=980251 RepID=A0A5B9PEE2_9BACT|nr:hypothetical protein [Mariniblastus fucicola]QEG21323.1 hypothetical protein MFFC18_11790 [Mariniblastus fucicola]